MKVLLTLLLLFCITESNAQLPNFELTVEVLNETCSGNGALSFSVSGTAAGAEIIYTIFQSPNFNSPIATLSSLTLTGLVAGQYRVVATQTVGSNSSFEQEDVTILDNTDDLQYSVSAQNALCGDDGVITATVTSGNVAGYELFSGPEIRPLQTSNIFLNLLPGAYQIRVYDICGDALAQNHTIAASTPFINIIHQSTILNTCNSIEAIDNLDIGQQPGAAIAYPVTVTYVVTPATGSPFNFTNVIASGSTAQSISQIIPVTYDQTYSYVITAVDNCGNVFVSEPRTFHPVAGVTLSATGMDCLDKSLVVYINNYSTSPFTVTFLSAPAGFNPIIYNDNHPGPFTQYSQYYNPDVQLPEGVYLVQITDSCGRTATDSILIQYVPTVAAPNVILQQIGCETGYGSFQMYNAAAGIEQATLISAPAGYPNSLPENVGQFINNTDYLQMGPLAEGTYVINTVDDCGQAQTTTIDLIGNHVYNTVVSIEPGCSTFNVNLDHQSSFDNPLISSQPFYYLQQWNDVTEQWLSVPASPTEYQLINHTNNLNLNYTGHFRILKIYSSNINGNDEVTCEEILYEFDFSGVPAIIGVHPFACGNGVSEVMVEAVGVAPLQYSITEKDGQPFQIINGNNSLFSGLTTGVYNFQLGDGCGNILNHVYDITIPIALSIEPQNLCEGEDATLTLPNLSFLDFLWWKENDNGNILSTTNTLEISDFDPVTDAGVYHAVLVYNNINSCVDQELTFEINSEGSQAQAGADVTAEFCNPAGIINLDQLLEGPHSDSGIWTQETAGGNFTDGTWETTDVLPGLYEFKYSVTGFCSSDESSVSILIKYCGIPQGISPDDDGSNDSFDLSGLDVDKVKIFNRYGITVFEQQGNQNYWRGQDFRGNQLPSATYYYLVELASGEAKSGWVYLLRR
ncbi:MAG TPA: gliding motility-associated C-terminal domain-containing protein [Flavobacterium sp.]